MTTLLITRPRQDAESLALAITGRGFDSFVEPLLTVAPVPENAPSLIAAVSRAPGALIATSRHALTAAAQMITPPDIPLLVVGIATSEYAAKLGYRCAAFSETAQALPDLVEKHFGPKERPRLLYLRGEEVSADVAAALALKGFSVDAIILYRATPAHAFSAALQAALKAGDIAGVLFFSRRTAETYARLARQHALAEPHCAMRAFCISETVSQAVRSLPWRAVHLARSPDMPQMLEALNDAFKS